MNRILVLLLLIFVCTTIYSQEQITVVCFGNSTTAFRKGVNKVYSVRLHEKLDRAGVLNRVINSGVGSSHTGSIKDNDFAKVVHAMDRFDTAVLRHHADWVTINFGLNDAYQDNGPGTPARIPLKNYKKNIRYFIKKVRKQGSRVILLTPNPQTSAYEEFRRQNVKAYAEAIKKIAKCKNTYLIDTWRLFYDWGQDKPDNIDSLFLDKLHPNDAGHELVAQAVFEIIRKHHKY
ncbi:MAG: lipolytic protein G-D-S-L family [Sphingobacteriales bacterium 41-5]|mgnify:CR=1 FL=1|nr:MAG: lipolytic protein G-D-S-L family [Sphingobacteriales bacterium 41-5]